MDEATITPTELAAQIWGQSENHSRSWGAREVRKVAHDLFPSESPDKGSDWNLTAAQADAIRQRARRSIPA
jgi:hypothetical protein